MVEVGGRVEHGQVMEAHIAVAAEAVQATGRCGARLCAALPGPGLAGGA